MNSNNIQFTRYLYNKQYCKTALALSMLNKKIDQSLFWAYELLFSGFKNETYECLVTIYYDFYYILNASFEKYLLDMIQNHHHDFSTVYFIIINLIKRHYSTDIFMLKGLTFSYDYVTEVENKTKNHCEQIFHHFIKHHFIELTIILLLPDNEFSNQELIMMYTKILDYYISQGLIINNVMKIKEFQQLLLSTSIILSYKRILFLSRIIHLQSLYENKKQGKAVYIRTLPTEDELYPFYTHLVDEELSADKILSFVTKYGINDIEFISLFHSLDIEIVSNAYLYNWEYYSYDTPVWKERFEYFGGIKDDETKTIQFENHEKKDQFYYLFGYQPEEQNQTIQNKSIIKKNQIQCSTIDFFENYSKENTIPLIPSLLENL